MLTGPASSASPRLGAQHAHGRPVWPLLSRQRCARTSNPHARLSVDDTVNGVSPFPGPSNLTESIELSPLVTTPLLSVYGWRCLHDTAELRAERRYASPVLTLIRNGVSEVHSEGRTSLIDPTCASYRPAGIPYSTTHPFGCGDEGYNIVLAPEVASEILGSCGLAEDGRARIGPLPAGVYLRQLLTLDGLSKGERSESPTLALEEALLNLVRDFLSGRDRPASRTAPARKDTHAEHHETVERARKFLSFDLQRPLGLAEVAAAAHTSPYHLCRVFRRLQGDSVHGYRNRLRLRKALHDMVTTRRSLTELAFELGYSSHSHFTAAFRKEFGLGPADARRLYGKRGRCVG